MGSWNATCAISNLHITSGEKVVVFLLARNNEEKTFCFGNALYDLCPIPFYGKYNDYGGVEDCHGFGLNIVVESLREQLYEFGQGPNSIHDIEVNKKNLNIEVLFDADNEDRLAIEDYPRFNSIEYAKREMEKIRDEKGLTDSQQFELDRLMGRLKGVDPYRQVTHVQIHGKVFNDIMNNWYITEYVGNGKGDKGYNNSYIHLYFKDILATLPAYIENKKKEQEELESIENNATISGITAARHAMRILARSDIGYGDTCIAGRWLQDAIRDTNMRYVIVKSREHINDYCDKKDWIGLENFCRELLIGLWINSFMSHIRKIWVKQSGAGSQNAEPVGYKLLSESVLRILKEEQEELDSWEDESEGESEILMVEETREYKDYLVNE